MAKIALIVPNNLWVCPYLYIYTRILDSLGKKYEIISWNRDGKEEPGIQFQYHEKTRNKFIILWSYFKYSLFLKKTIKNNHYEKLVVFSPQVGLFLSVFLEKYYKGRYVFDYRDLSFEQKPFFSKRFKIVLSNSYANIISSPGFKKYLPTEFEYLVSHNFNDVIVQNALNAEASPYQGADTLILTIGALRTDMNIEVMDALGNQPGFKLSFVGKGVAAEYLEKYASSKGYKNVVFSGYYKKENEADIIKQHTMINIVYPLIPSHISAISNRFYNSLIYKRPMIVTKNTVQGDYVQQYNVGLIIDNCEKLKERVLEYRNEIDYQKYCKQCNALLQVFLNENKVFKNSMSDFFRDVVN